ncbi:hypothetical protein [Aggregatilinea lenta]|uniref:hypothetical protein n=1 Tax=Aggregatilinea lenta TaxID=913108 RepID=UPI0013C34731|nr:hypothetical protein [Aggregatilinea lenta]
MNQHIQTQRSAPVRSFSPCTVTCALQVLVVDHAGGPASILADSASRLLDARLSVIRVEDHDDALYVIANHGVDLVLVGLEADDPVQMTLLPQLRLLDTALPALIIDRTRSWLHEQQARRFGAQDVIALPRRAAELKAFIARLTHEYLEAA